MLQQENILYYKLKAIPGVLILLRIDFLIPQGFSLLGRNYNNLSCHY